MAIGFARLKFVKRSASKNACQKSSYAGNLAMKDHSLRKHFYYFDRKSFLYYEIMLPFNVDQKFMNSEFLWNEVEKKKLEKNLK